MTQLGAIIYLIDKIEVPALLYASCPCSLWHVKCSTDGVDEWSQETQSQPPGGFCRASL